MEHEEAVETIELARRKIIVVLLTCVAFAVAGAVLIAAGNVFGWIAVVFAPGIPIALIQFVRPAFVRIEPQVVTVRQVIGRTRTYELNRCGPVGVWFYGGRARGVAFDYDYPGAVPRWARLTRRQFSASEHLSDLYTFSPQQLAEALERARHEAAGRAS